MEVGSLYLKTRAENAVPELLFGNSHAKAEGKKHPGIHTLKNVNSSTNLIVALSKYKIRYLIIKMVSKD